MIDIGERIKSIRKQKRITQREICKKANCSNSTLSRWENGDRNPTFDCVQRVCDALGVSIAELCKEDSDRKTTIDKQIIADSIEHYGEEAQSTVCMEECAELIQAISKELRGKSDRIHLAEEIADVLICIEILKQIYGITDELILDWIKSKQKRIVERMKK